MLEGAKRRASMYFLPNFLYSREIYPSSQQQFFNANFAWNQYEVPQNLREAKNFFNII